MSTSVHFWNLFAKQYSKIKIADPEAYQIKLDETQQYFTKESTVLEFGCGTGSTALVHAPHVKKIVAIDYSPKMIAIAQEKMKLAHIENVEFKVGVLEELNFQPQTFDVVLGLNILHLVPDVASAMKKSFDLLKPGGVFITSTACLGKTGVLKLLLPPLAKFGLVPNVNFLDANDLLGIFNSVGFTILQNITPGKNKKVHFIIAKKS